VKTELKVNPQSPWQLFNLDEDPSETQDIAALNPEIIATMDSLQKQAHRHPHIREWEFIDPKFKK
jgi:arylsulfatase A